MNSDEGVSVPLSRKAREDRKTAKPKKPKNKSKSAPSSKLPPSSKLKCTVVPSSVPMKSYHPFRTFRQPFHLHTAKTPLDHVTPNKDRIIVPTT